MVMCEHLAIIIIMSALVILKNCSSDINAYFLKDGFVIQFWAVLFACGLPRSLTWLANSWDMIGAIVAVLRSFFSKHVCT